MIQSIWEFLTSFNDVWYPLFLGMTAFVETLFPPFPGDVVYIALAGLGWSSGIPAALLWFPGFAGCFVSTLILDHLGRSSGLEKLEKLVIGSSRKNGLDRAKRIISRRGPWVLVASRFVPGIRSLLVIAAASSGMKRSSVIGWASLSAGAWYAIMTAAGYFAGSTLDDADHFMKGFSTVLWVLLAAVILTGVFIVLFRLRRAEE